MTESRILIQDSLDKEGLTETGPLRFGPDHLISDLNFEPEIQTIPDQLSWDRNFGPEIQIISYSQNFSWFIHP